MEEVNARDEGTCATRTMKLALTDRSGTTREQPERPDTLIEDDDYGVRLSGFVGGWDFSVNYMYHYQDRPVLFRQAAPGGGLRINPRYNRTHLAGGGFSNAFGDVTVRGEFGYSTDRFVITRNANDRDASGWSGT